MKQSFVSVYRVCYVNVSNIFLQMCATSRKVASSRADEVNFAIYHTIAAALGPVSSRNEYQKQKNSVSGEYNAAGA
jgi:hypothetical protein